MLFFLKSALQDWRAALHLVIKLIEKQSERETERLPWYVLAMQQAWKKEIEAAIRKVKRKVPVRKRKWFRRKRRHRTPEGFIRISRRGRLYIDRRRFEILRSILAERCIGGMDE